MKVCVLRGFNNNNIFPAVTGEMNVCYINFVVNFVTKYMNHFRT